MNKNIITFIIFSLFLIIGTAIISSHALFHTSVLPKKNVMLGGKSFFVEIASTNESKVKGLSFHKPLLEDEGMIFVFDTPDTYGFWMKDMTFPIDIIWIDENLRIVHIEKSLSPSTYPHIFYPESPVRYVLEITSGQSDELKIKIGDTVVFQK